MKHVNLTIHLVITLTLSGFAFNQVQAGTLASSNFDTGLDGWTSNTPAQVVWQSVGGNPGGFMLFTDADASSTVVDAPSSFRGDYITAGVSSISFDDNIIAEAQVLAISPYEIDLSGPGGSAIWLGTTPSLAPGWINVAAPISDGAPSSGWTVTSGTWNGLLSDVTQLQIPIELVTNNQSIPFVDQEGIDNVDLKSAVAAAPESSTWALMIAGIAIVGGMLRFERRRKALATV